RLAVEAAPPFAPGAKPWFVTGGVDETTLDDVLATGARRVVVVRGVTGAADPGAAAGSLARRLRAADGQAAAPVRHLADPAVLAACLVGTAPLELFLRTRVYRRPLRLLLTLGPVVAVFVAWDLYAIARGHWRFDRRSTSGIVLPGRLPLEELLF